MIEDKVVVALFLLGIVALMLAGSSKRLSRSQLTGLGFFPALYVWLGAPLTHPLSWVASIVAALSVPLLVYGWDDIRHAFMLERKGI